MLMNLSKAIRKKVGQLAAVERRLQRVQEALGRIEARQLSSAPIEKLQDAEFRVFSQWGEDGIIRHLVRSVPIEQKIFVEFGVETYVEANTRFLLIDENWSGLVIDGNKENIEFIRNDPIYWQHNLKAECSFITRENINDLIGRNGVRGEIGLLSIDIDGNDYWVWQAIDIVNPVIVVAEYNARFGAHDAVTVPYDPMFVRDKAHHSMIYYGASLAALASIGEAKGYALVGCNSAGNNVFFVRKDRLPASMKSLTPAEAYVRNQFRETRNLDGSLMFIAPEDERATLAGLPLVDVNPVVR